MSLESESTNKITFINYENEKNEKVQEVSFDMTLDDSITRIISEFRMFLLGQGYSEKLVNEYVPYCDTWTLDMG